MATPHPTEFWTGPIDSWSVGYYTGCRGLWFTSEDRLFLKGWGDGYAQHLTEAVANMRRRLDGSEKERAPKGP